MKRFIVVENMLRSRGIRLTAPRELIVRRAVSHLHFGSEELVNDVQAIDPSIARATVYRTILMLCKAWIVEKHDFHYGPPSYEVTFGRAHHDHLMCVRCGKIIEFQEPSIERMQKTVVRRYKYQLLSHTHKLYGLCPLCQRKKPGTNRRQVRLHIEKAVS